MRKKLSRVTSAFALSLPTTYCLLLIAGCATPQYAVRATPVPEESVEALQIERAISAVQAQGFERQGARPIQEGERLWGFDVQSTLERLSRVTERPQLAYRAYLYQDRDPNAAALADGRIYLSNGMLSYLAGRGSREEELAVIISHEIAHTVAQHLVKRYRWLQQQGLLMTLVAAGASAVTGDAGSSARELGRLALDVVSMLQDVANSGYSQDQELEADQLGIRYVMRAGYDPRAAL
ncbi:MAG: M48 family metalloprotease, partial [Candidatus Omnitrophica bacterium]|nr:M48 family metalloprotease [Candidatus Omnitrophota bacterium]